MSLCGWGSFDGLAQQAYQRCKLWKLRLTLWAASRDGRIIHLAAHPHNFAGPDDLEYLEEVLRLVSGAVEAGRLRIETMAGLMG